MNKKGIPVNQHCRAAKTAEGTYSIYRTACACANNKIGLYPIIQLLKGFLGRDFRLPGARRMWEIVCGDFFYPG
jgi:hypothetical protein